MTTTDRDGSNAANPPARPEKAPEITLGPPQQSPAAKAWGGSPDAQDASPAEDAQVIALPSDATASSEVSQETSGSGAAREEADSAVSQETADEGAEVEGEAEAGVVPAAEAAVGDRVVSQETDTSSASERPVSFSDDAGTTEVSQETHGDDAGTDGSAAGRQANSAGDNATESVSQETVGGSSQTTGAEAKLTGIRAKVAANDAQTDRCTNELLPEIYSFGIEIDVRTLEAMYFAEFPPKKGEKAKFTDKQKAKPFVPVVNLCFAKQPSEKRAKGTISKYARVLKAGADAEMSCDDFRRELERHGSAEKWYSKLNDSSGTKKESAAEREARLARELDDGDAFLVGVTPMATVTGLHLPPGFHLILARQTDGVTKLLKEAKEIDTKPLRRKHSKFANEAEQQFFDAFKACRSVKSNNTPEAGSIILRKAGEEPQDILLMPNLTRGGNFEHIVFKFSSGSSFFAPLFDEGNAFELPLKAARAVEGSASFEGRAYGSAIWKACENKDYARINMHPEWQLALDLDDEIPWVVFSNWRAIAEAQKPRKRAVGGVGKLPPLRFWIENGWMHPDDYDRDPFRLPVPGLEHGSLEVAKGVLLRIADILKMTEWDRKELRVSVRRTNVILGWHAEKKLADGSTVTFTGRTADSYYG